ncbi:annexin A5a isoform X1, partial [Tachysurus ichikawai]
MQIWVELSAQAYRGSVRPFVHFNAKQDADILRKAMKGIGEEALFILIVKLSLSSWFCNH